MRSTPCSCGLRGQADGGLDVDSALGPVSGGDPQQQRHGLGDHVADGVDDGEHQPVPSRLVPAPGVGAVVGQRALELVQQVAVGAVHFNGVEAGVDGPHGGGGEVAR